MLRFVAWWFWCLVVTGTTFGDLCFAVGFLLWCLLLVVVDRFYVLDC